MRLPAFLIVLWPIAAFAGGKIFAPLLFIFGLVFGWRHLKQRPRLDIIAFIVFLSWVCLSILWSPENAPVISGSLSEGDFAIEAAYLRFVFSALGVCLFLAVLIALPDRSMANLPKYLPLAILLQLGILIVLALQRDKLLVADSSHPFVPSMQSVGRNANLLALVVPIAIGVWADRFERSVAIALSVALLGVGGWVLVVHDALAGLLAWGLASAIAVLLFANGRSGFRRVFNLIAGAIVGMPVLIKTLLALVPAGDLALPLSARQRLAIWQNALEKIGEKPVFGHGVDAINVWDETYASRPDLLAQLDPSLVTMRLIPNHTHNMPLQVWAETGLIGAVLLALVFVALGRVMPAPSTLTLGNRIAIAGVIGGALALFSVAYSAWDESFWASLGVVCCALIIMARQSPKPAK